MEKQEWQKEADKGHLVKAIQLYMRETHVGLEWAHEAVIEYMSNEDIVK